MNIDRRSPYKITDEQVVIRLYQTGISAPVIAERFGCSSGTVYNVLKRHNIPRIKRRRHSRPHNTRGPRHPRWKGDTSLVERLRTHYKMVVKWHEQIKTRDKHRCRLCDSTQGLHAHHLVSFTQIVRLYKNRCPDLSEEQLYDCIIRSPLLYSLHLGVTLCRTCHIKVHKNLRELGKEALFGNPWHTFDGNPPKNCVFV